MARQLAEIFGQTHESLVKTAIEIAKVMGYTHIVTEYDFNIPDQFIKGQHGQQRFIVDVYGRNERGETIAFECGDLSKGNFGIDELDRARRLAILSLLVDKLVWMPYFTSKTDMKLNQGQVIIEVDELKRQKEELEREIKSLEIKHSAIKNRMKDYERYMNGIMNLFKSPDTT